MNQQPQQPPVNVNQVNTSIIGMTSAVFTSIAATIVTTAVKANVLVDKTFNVAIHGVAAAEHVARAGEERAKIYGEGIVNNGVLSEREITLKHKLRLYALEQQEKALLESEKPRKIQVGKKPATVQPATNGAQAPTQPATEA